jgi:phage I-like protein
MTHFPLLNRSGKLPEDGWVHVVPLGTFPHPSGVDQVIDARALNAMAQAFDNRVKSDSNYRMLVDFDHFSDDLDKSSEAAGWIHAVQNRDNGLWAQVDWSDSGRASVEGKRFRYVSPVFTDTEKLTNGIKLRVRNLHKVALTNEPNLRGMVPLSNRSESDKDAGTTTTTKEQKHMKSIAGLFGLAAEASEDAIVAQATKLQNRSKELETELSTLKERITTFEAANVKLLEAQITSDLVKYANRFKPEAKDAWKARLLADRDGTIKLLESLETSDPKAMANRSAMGTPAASAADPGVDKSAQFAAEVQRYRLNNRAVSFDEAWNATAAAHPELVPAQ